jgi:hypothetical protein
VIFSGVNRDHSFFTVHETENSACDNSTGLIPVFPYFCSLFKFWHSNYLTLFSSTTGAHVYCTV